MKAIKKQNPKVAINKDAELMWDASASLSDRERLFVLSYIQTLNGPDAALAAGYTGNRNVLRSMAHKIIHRPNVREAIDSFLFSVFMNAAEMKARISAIARGSFENFLDINEVSGTASINMAKAEERGMLGLVKKYRTREIVNSKGEQVITSELELYDAQEALVHIGRIQGLFNDHVEAGIGKCEGPLEVMVKLYRDGMLNDGKEK